MYKKFSDYQTNNDGSDPKKNLEDRPWPFGGIAGKYEGYDVTQHWNFTFFYTVTEWVLREYQKVAKHDKICYEKSSIRMLEIIPIMIKKPKR